MMVIYLENHIFFSNKNSATTLIHLGKIMTKVYMLKFTLIAFFATSGHLNRIAIPTIVGSKNPSNVKPEKINTVLKKQKGCKLKLSRQSQSPITQMLALHFF